MNRHQRHVNDQGARRCNTPRSRAFLFGCSTLPATHLRKSRLRTPPPSPRARTGHAASNVTARASLGAAWPQPPYRESLNCACNQHHKSPPLDPDAASVALPTSSRPPPLDQCPSPESTHPRLAVVVLIAVAHVTPALIGTSGPSCPFLHNVCACSGHATSRSLVIHESLGVPGWPKQAASLGLTSSRASTVWRSAVGSQQVARSTRECTSS